MVRPAAGLMRRVALLAAIAACPVIAQAAVPRCAVPTRLATPQPDVPTASDPARTVPIGGYTLAMIWGPQHCRAPVPGAAALGCTKASRRGFTLHGLWPDGEGRDWPQYCAPAAILPQRLLRAYYCATPSAQLMQHEWAKHGTCLPAADPAAYFARSNALFGALHFPSMGALSRRPTLTAGDFARAFAAANPGMTAAMVRLNLDKGGWLQEIWLCLDKSFAATACRAPTPAATPLRIWRKRA